jgi:hypothetical protein
MSQTTCVQIMHAIISSHILILISYHLHLALNRGYYSLFQEINSITYFFESSVFSFEHLVIHTKLVQHISLLGFVYQQPMKVLQE